MKFCEWCGCEINGWFFKYRGKIFCQHNHNSCLKNYLFDEADKEIEEDRIDNHEYTMDMVTFMEERA